MCQACANIAERSLRQIGAIDLPYRCLEGIALRLHEGTPVTLCRWPDGAFMYYHWGWYPALSADSHIVPEWSKCEQVCTILPMFMGGWDGRSPLTGGVPCEL